MSILTKVLLGLAVVAVFPVLYLAAAVLNVNHAWHQKVVALENVVREQSRQVEQLRDGDFAAQAAGVVPGKPDVGKPGVEQYKTVLANLKLGRSRLWYATRVTDSVNPDTGTLKMKILNDKVEQGPTREGIKEHGIVDKQFLYVFQMAHDGEPNAGDDRYVGEFVVSGLTVDAATKLPPDEFVPLKPSLPPAPDDWEKLRSGSGSWVVYESMPADGRNALLGMSDDEIRRRMPASVAEEYVADDKEPTEAILKNDVLKQYVVSVKDERTGAETKKFLRPLRDYQRLFHEAAVRTTEINDRLTVLRKEKEYADRALVKAQAASKSLDDRKLKLAEEVKLLEAERELARAHVTKLEAAVAQAEQQLSTLLATNKQLATGRGGRAAMSPVAPAPAAAAARTP